ncbi:MAG: hypothetical protein EZS28_026503 [Streblomastix strix]|uniref:Uncharacterized protein n=1 Tax=Streblomastix strix TaxID=222440 RepID=A0A5J4V567_9EUKA|nr:MAG: hypothetical protein EZS28_026503 [Streblomastix strix]
MQCILESEVDRIDSRRNHPIFEEMRRDGVIYSVSQNCLICGETEYIQQNAAFVLGTLLRAQDIQQLSIRDALIKQLKKLIIENKRVINIDYLLDIMCSLAVKQQNNFIETIAKLAESQDNDIKSYALELLLLIAQNGGVEIENEVKSTIGKFKFLELIGDSDSALNEQILQLTLKCH